MKRPSLPLLPIAFGLAALFLAGCNSYEHDSTGLYAKNNRGTNVLGIVDTSPASYKKVSDTTLQVESDEVVKRKNISGDNVSLFWGAFTYTDY
ncbi:MAG: hypothetical protein ACQKBW_06295 [Puniceicoccales bacterium]